MKKILIVFILLLISTGCGNSKIYKKYVVNNSITVNKEINKLIEIDYNEYSLKIDNKESFVLIIYQTGCPHCESYEPKMNDLISYYHIPIYAINTSKITNEEYEIIKNKTFTKGTPTTVYFKEGKYEEKIVGDRSQSEIIEFLIKANYLEEK